jgi:DNA-directed RNA polymerase specialized sigma subunit
MDSFELDFNPFPFDEIKYNSNLDTALLFNAAQKGDQLAMDKLIIENSKYIEKIIFQLQHYNIPEKLTFTELYDIGVKTLNDLIKDNNQDSFDRFRFFVIRQKMLDALGK